MKFRLAVFVFWATLIPAGQALAQEFFEGALYFKVDTQGPQAEELKLNEPNKEMVMFLREGDYIVQLRGGRYPKTFLYINSEDMEYSVDAQANAAYRLSGHSDLKQEVKVTPLALPTGQQAEVMGVMCDIYRMQRDNANFLLYVSDQYRIDLSRYKGKENAKPLFLVQGLEGRIPLKTVKKEPGLTVSTTVVKIEPKPFSPDQFSLPPGTEIKRRDYRF